MEAAIFPETLTTQYRTTRSNVFAPTGLDSTWDMMAHGEAREGKWRWNWRMQWVSSTFHTTSEHGVSSISTSDAHTSAGQ